MLQNIHDFLYLNVYCYLPKWYLQLSNAVESTLGADEKFTISKSQQLANAWWLIFSRLLGKSTHFSFIQRANAKCSMTLRFFATTILSMFLQPEKHLSLMTSILFLKIRVVIPSQQVNACLPIFMTDCGMVDIEVC